MVHYKYYSKTLYAMNSVLIMRQYAVNVVTYKRQKSFLEYFICVITRKLDLRICGIVRF